MLTLEIVRAINKYDVCQKATVDEIYRHLRQLELLPAQSKETFGRQLRELRRCRGLL